MKFGRQLSELVDPKFRTYCVAYNMLKTLIRETDSKTGKTIQTIQDVTSAAVPYLPPAPAEQLPTVLFQDVLMSELDKINRFSDLEQETILNDLRAVVRRIYSVDRSSASFEAAIVPIREEVDRIASEVCSFAGFVNINYTAFRKITKKESKVHRSSNAAWFMANVARAPFMNVDFERLLSAISLCYELIRSSQLAIESTPMARVALSSDRVMAAWVSGDDLWEVKVALSKVMTLELVLPSGFSRQGILENVLSSSTKKVTAVMGHRELKATYYDTPWLESYKNQLAMKSNTGGMQVEYDEETATVSLPSGNRFSLSVTDWDAVWKTSTKNDMVDPDALEEVASLVKAGYKPMVSCAYGRYVFYCTDESFGPIEIRIEEKALFATSEGDALEDNNSKFTGNALYITVPRNSPKQLPEWLTEITGMPGVTDVPNFSKRLHGLFLFADNKIGAGVPYPSWAVRKPPAASPKVLAAGAQSIVSFVERPQVVEPVVTSIEEPPPSWPIRWLDKLRLGDSSISPKGRVRTVRDAIIKIEPKSFFAAERNLLDWTHTCVVVSGVAALKGGFVGLIISVIPIVILLWEIVLHRMRNKNMMEKHGGSYEDMFGPPLLFIALMALAVDILASSTLSLF
jgi:SPX domain protein involved in polyphosphate accumulation